MVMPPRHLELLTCLARHPLCDRFRGVRILHVDLENPAALDGGALDRAAPTVRTGREVGGAVELLRVNEQCDDESGPLLQRGPHKDKVRSCRCEEPTGRSAVQR